MTTTPEKIIEPIIELCNELTGNMPVYVKCEARNWCVPNECFDNVRQEVEKKGGECILGWTIWQWDNVLVEAEAHAILKTIDGKMIDITPHQGEDKILFLQDDTMIFNGSSIKSHRKALTQSPLVSEVIKLSNIKDDILCNSINGRCDMPVELLINLQRLILAINKTTDRNNSCPCGSGIKYKKCCGRYREK